MGPEREVRLRSEYAGLYQDLTPDIWVPAREWADVLVRRASAARRLNVHVRTFDPRHFEFRGGPGHDDRPPGARTRSTDSPHR